MIWKKLKEWKTKMINRERWELLIEEFFICKVKENFYFVDKEGEEQIFLLDNGIEISIKDPKKE